MTIAFIASAEGNSDTDAASYSIAPLPTGIADNHLVIIAVACPTSTAGAVTFTGWNQIALGEDTGHRSSVWYRIAESDDTTATTFTFDPPGTPEGIAWVSCAYSGVHLAQPFIAEDATHSLADADRAVATPTVTNTRNDSWHVSAGMSSEIGTGDTTVDWTASTGTERNDIDAAESTSHHSVAMYDSNGTIATGGLSVTHTLGNTTTTNADILSWVGILQAENPQSGGGLLVQRQAVNRASFW